MTNLVIVESASKAKTIQKYLNQADALSSLGHFEVIASLGHIMDLPKKTIGVNMTTWKPDYVINETREKVIYSLKKMSKKAKRIYVASDPDREGEAIAKHLMDLFEENNVRGEMKRVAFHEITQEALVEAILNPRALDKDMIEAQESRRILDRVVGYEASPLLWRRFATSGLSAGRVQSATLKLMVDRYKEFTKHSFDKIWSLTGTFEMNGWKDPLQAKHYKVKDGSRYIWTKEEDVKTMLQLLKKSRSMQWTIAFKKKMVTRRPPAPLTTSTLQQEVYQKHSIPIDRTMRLAQELYEAGHITYMRTDSTNLSKTAQQKIAQWIGEHFSKEDVVMRVFKTKVANAQEAHEAIRPTNISERSVDLKGRTLTDGHRKVYEIIWRRAVASQMKDATFMDVEYNIQCMDPSMKHHEFRGSQDVLVEPGYMAVLQPDMKVSPKQLELLEQLVEFGKNATVKPSEFLFDGDVTRPAPLFQEASIVKLLEKEGIGRPSTYATILRKVFEKGYVLKGPAPAHVEQVVHKHLQWGSDAKITEKEETLTIGGKESNLLIPTSRGIDVIEYLDEVLSIIVEKGFTAKMEEELDDISRGELSKKQMMDQFYKEFHPNVEKALEIQKKIAKEKKKERDEAKASGKPLEEKVQKGPSNILKEFPTFKTNIVQTRYGPALYHLEEKRFVSVTPLLQWKKKTLEDVTQKDVRFLLRLPIVVEETELQIHVGRYGLYVKKNGIENMKLKRDVWDKVYEGDFSKSDIEKNVEAVVPKSKSGFKNKFAKKEKEPKN
jgi:DNA topoisomerase-1